MKLKRANAPHHGLGEHGSVHRKAGLMAGAHLPQRVKSGHSDAKGYQSSAERRNGEHTGSLKSGDTRVRKGAEGNSKGSPPPGVSKGAKHLATHMGDSGRGGAGRHGKGDNFKGRATDLSESPSSAWFEQLGAK